MEYNIPIKEGGLYKAILMVMNPFLELTVGQREILCEILKLDTRVLNSTTRSMIREATGIKGFNFNNYVSQLKKKGLLVDGEHKELRVHPRVIDMVGTDTVKIRFYLPNKEV